MTSLTPFLLIVCLFFSSVSSKIIHLTQCEPGLDFDYTFASAVQLWGEDVDQLLRTTTDMEVKCMGECPDAVCPGNEIRNASTSQPNLFHVKLSNPRAWASSLANDTKPQTVTPLDHRLLLPFRFAQHLHGGIANVFFTRGDDVEEILNYKRTIIGAFQANLDSAKPRAKQQDVLGTHLGHFLFQTGDNMSTAVVNKTFDQTDFEDRLDQLEFKSSASTGTRRRMGVNQQRQGPIKLRGTDSKSFESGTLETAQGEVHIFYNGKDETLFHSDEVEEEKREKRSSTDEEGEDVDILKKHLKAKMMYSLERKAMRKRREVAEKIEKEEEFEFVNGTMESTKRKSNTGMLIRLDKIHKEYVGKVQELLTSVLKGTASAEGKKMEELSEGLWIESQMGVRKLASEVEDFVQKIDIKETCLQASWSNCIIILRLLKPQDEAELNAFSYEDFLFNMLEDKSLNQILTPIQERDLHILLADANAPSAKSFLLLQKAVLTSTGPVDASLLFAFAKIASKPSINDALKEWTAKFLLAPLYNQRCQATDDLFLRLQAIAILKYPKVLPGLLRLFEICDPVFGNSLEIRIGVLGAIQDLLHEHVAQQILKMALESGSCPQMEAVLAVLIESHYAEDEDWLPIDELIIDMALDAQYSNDTSSDPASCIFNQLNAYLAIKSKVSVEHAHALKSVQEKILKVKGSTPAATRQKRSIIDEEVESWTDSSCMTWGNPGGVDDRTFDPIESPAQFREDSKFYDNRRHCLGHKRIGISKISADFYAGLFAGKSIDSNGIYKLYQKFVATGNFYNIPFEIGKVSWMKTNKPGEPISQRYLVAAGDFTVFDNKDTHCGQASPVNYGRTFSVSIQDIPLYVATISFAVTITPHIGVHFICHKLSSGHVTLAIKPKAKLRIGGGATASLAIAVQGGIDVGVNLNYFVDSETDLTPCVSANHGFDPMSVTVSAWYQHAASPRKDWHPEWAEWEILRGTKGPWVGPQCSKSKDDIATHPHPPEFSAHICTRWYKEKVMELGCQAPATIVIRSAFYGWSTAEENCFFIPRDTYCTKNTTLLECSGQSFCSIDAARSQWAVGCSGLHDYLQVLYDCVDPNSGAIVEVSAAEARLTRDVSSRGTLSGLARRDATLR